MTPSKEAVTLLNCPFCGVSPTMKHRNGVQKISCPTVYCVGHYGWYEIKAWNTRAPDTAAEERGAERMREMAAKLLDDGAKYRLSETFDHAAEDWSAEIRNLPTKMEGVKPCR